MLIYGAESWTFKTIMYYGPVCERNEWMIKYTTMRQTSSTPCTNSRHDGSATPGLLRRYLKLKQTEKESEVINKILVSTFLSKYFSNTLLILYLYKVIWTNLQELFMVTKATFRSAT